MKAIVFDTETTGKFEPQIIEAAYVHVTIDGLIPLSEAHQRYAPTKPIEFGAMAIHNIIPSDLKGCPSHTSFKLPDDVDYIIGHNVDYDWEVAGKPEVKRICVLALAREYLPELDSHTQSALLYYIYSLDNEEDVARNMLKGAHSALTDVHNCLAILQYLVHYIGNVESWEHLWQLSEEARIPKTMPFGKHKGELIKDVPANYKDWLLRQPDVDPYLRMALV